MNNATVNTFCALCANHYGDDGQCDRGLPVSSPHRSGQDTRTVGLPLPVRGNLTAYVTGHAQHTAAAQESARLAYLRATGRQP